MKLSKFFLYMPLVCIMSCNSSSDQVASKPERLKIEGYLDSIQLQFKGYGTNTVIKDEMNAFMRKNFVKAFDDGIVSDLPFELNRVEKCDDKYIVNLEHSLSSKFYNRDALADLELDIYAEIDEKTAKQLLEKKFYLINGSFQDYITFRNNSKYCALVLMSPYTGFDSSSIGKEIQFGAIGIKLKEIKPFIEK